MKHPTKTPIISKIIYQWCEAVHPEGPGEVAYLAVDQCCETEMQKRVVLSKIFWKWAVHRETHCTDGAIIITGDG